MIEKIKGLFKKKRKDVFYINKRLITITPLSFTEMEEVVFLFLPYLKIILTAKEEYKSSTPADVYYDILYNSLSQIQKDDSIKILSIFLHQDMDFCRELSYKDILRMLPTIIRVNSLTETFHLLYLLGAFK